MLANLQSHKRCHSVITACECHASVRKLTHGKVIHLAAPRRFDSPVSCMTRKGGRDRARRAAPVSQLRLRSRPRQQLKRIEQNMAPPPIGRVGQVAQLRKLGTHGNVATTPRRRQMVLRHSMIRWGSLQRRRLLQGFAIIHQMRVLLQKSWRRGQFPRVVDASKMQSAAEPDIPVSAKPAPATRLRATTPADRPDAFGYYWQARVSRLANVVQGFGSVEPGDFIWQ